MLLFLIGLSFLAQSSGQILGLEEGDECQPLGGGQGACKPLSQCRDPGDFRRDHPPICTFKNKEPVICCPTKLVTRVNSGLKVEQYCQSFFKAKRRSCLLRHLFLGKAFEAFDPNEPQDVDGSQRNRVDSQNYRMERHFVFGGREVKAHIATYMALIGYGNQNEKSWGCGGSLISAKYVLSAAHCVNPYSLGLARWARLGDLDLSSNQEDAKPVEMRIVERITYPDYIDSQVYHDIALFKLDGPVVFNAWVMPVCLHTKKDIPETSATVTGWGRTDFAAGTSDKLLEAKLLVYNDTECNKLMFSLNSTRTPKGYQSDFMFCAGVPDGKKDACLGDSGGPLVIRKAGNCIKTQIGITSYGNQCGLPNSPGVYTRVSYYVGWIETIVFGNDMII